MVHRGAWLERQAGRSARGERGFTLVELSRRHHIIALIMGIVGPRVLIISASRRRRLPKIQIESFASALDLYFLDTGRNIPSARKALARWCAGRQHHCLERALSKGGVVPPDPWGNAYVYRSPGQEGRTYDIPFLRARRDRRWELGGTRHHELATLTARPAASR